MKKILVSLTAFAALSGHAQTDLFASWASKDVHYEQKVQPVMKATADTLITVWRGERAAMEALLYVPESTRLQLRLTPLKKGSVTLPASCAQAGFIDYVTTNTWQGCGYPPNDKMASYQVADVISTGDVREVEARSAAPVWCTLDIPQAAEPGLYRTQLEVVGADGRKVVRRLSLSVKVLDRTLPEPGKQQFHVDFWQQPYAVSRYHNVPRWSEAHFEALKPYLRLLARSGQKVVSAILFYEPWGEQSFDKFDPMVRTRKTKDGWAFDYEIFDRYVALCEECGISGRINCFSMVPWDMSFRYYDERAGKEVDLKTTTSSAEYKELWTAFLRSFAAHLREKGWYDKTCIAMDERGLNNMMDAWQVAQNAVPGMKMALAGSYHKELVDKLDDYCVGYGELFSKEELKARRDRGQVSTTYTCCSTPAPNLFTNSLPAESAFLPVYCAANDFDGYLHWSWMNWAEKPLTDSRYRMFSPGDTYLIYPGPLSSVRYERFIEGVAMAEKIRLLREQHAKSGDTRAMDELNRAVAEFAPVGVPQGKSASGMVNALQRLLNK